MSVFDPLRTLSSSAYFPPMKRKLRRASALALGILATTFIANPSLAHALGPRAVLAKHDPEKRLPNTSIERLGTIRVSNAGYAIYYLNFANPVSHHGQQRIAVIKNGIKFMGSHQCTLGREQGKVVIKPDRVTVTLFGRTSAIRFSGSGPSADKFFCGESSGWERSI